MKIVLITRKKTAHAFSIERVFTPLIEHMRPHTVVRYELRTRFFWVSDVLALRRLSADIYHITGDVNYLAIFLPWKKTVLTVHDIGNYLFGLSGIKRFLYKYLWFVLPVYVSKNITAVSEKTRKDLLSHFPSATNKVTVVENSVMFQVDRPLIKPVNPRYPHILQVGTQPYKNVCRLVEALSGIPCCLVLVGQISEELQGLLDKYQTDYQHHLHLSDAQIIRLYQDCDLVTFISVGEGFGLPILEAQVSGRPLVTSQIEPLCSVAGGAACLVDPLSVPSMREGILRVIHDSEYAGLLVQRGFANVMRFSPDVIAGQYLDLYRRMHPEGPC
jgi:glycosyltransferase involved in cell wall biosynthesis